MDADDAPSALMQGLALAPPRLICAADLALERGLYAPEDAAASRPLFEARLAELGIHPVARRPADGAALYAPPLPRCSSSRGRGSGCGRRRRGARRSGMLSGRRWRSSGRRLRL